MKRSELIRYLERHGCLLVREGGRHAIYRKPANGLTAPVPRHVEIADLLVRKICEELEIPRP